LVGTTKGGKCGKGERGGIVVVVVAVVVGRGEKKLWIYDIIIIITAVW